MVAGPRLSWNAGGRTPMDSFSVLIGGGWNFVSSSQSFLKHQQTSVFDRLTCVIYQVIHPVSKKIDKCWCESWCANEQPRWPVSVLNNQQMVATGWGLRHSSVEKCCCQGDSAGGYLAVQTFLEQTHPKICGAVGICPPPLGPNPTSKFEFCWDASAFLNIHRWTSCFILRLKIRHWK